MSDPANPSQGKAGEAGLEDEAKQAAEAVGKEQAAEAAEAPKPKAKAKAKAKAKPKPAAEAPAGDATAEEPAGDATAEEPVEQAKRSAAGGERSETLEPAEKPAAKSKPKAKAAAKKAAPKAAPSRRRRDADGAPVIVRAQARYVRSSARKARLVADGVRGKSVAEARAALQFHPRQVSEAWTKLLESAIANAENNHDLVGDDLKIHAIYADEGPTIKRYRPRAMGRATRIRKRTSHLTIQLTPKD
jgi:ribosomal protein L22